MPLIVKDFNWRQTETLVNIEVPLHGVHQSKVDLFTSPLYLKASFERYFFEVFLLHDTNPQKSSCTLTATHIVFELIKCENGLWEELEIDIPKKEKMELKKKIIAEEHERFQGECKGKSERKWKLKRVAVDEAIQLDTRQRNQIDNIRNQEKTTALGDLQKWNKEYAEPKIIELPSSSSDEEEEINKKDIKPAPRKYIPLPMRRKLPDTPVSIPLPRKTAELKVDFTTRHFPTPLRESQTEEENEWLRKQAEVRRSIGFDSKDLRPEEKNPHYLKSKGEEFLKNGNLLAAISAFSFGIKLTDQFPDLFIGRSAAHFAQENYYKCAQDCSQALELLRPAVPSNLNERITCIARRGEALQRLGYLREAVNELEVAKKLRPTDQNVTDKLENAKNELHKQEEKEELERKRAELKKQEEVNKEK